jgi:plastocyanin
VNLLSPRLAAAVATAAVGAVILTGCGGSSDDSSSTPSAPLAEATIVATTPPTATATATATEDGVKAIDITMTGTKVSPAPGTIRIDKGTKVELTITRDSDGSIHLHGIGEDSKDAKAGVPVTFSFTADESGVYEVESHDPDRLLTKLQVS